MKWFAIAFFCVIVTFSGVAQPHKIDSLLRKIQSFEDTDSAKIQTLIAVCKAYKKSDYDKAIVFGEKAVRHASNLGLIALEAVALNCLGACYRGKEEYFKAISYYENALQKYRAINNKEWEGNELANIGRVYTDLGDYAKAFDYQMKSFKLKQQYGSKENVANSLVSIGIIWRKQGKNMKASGYFQKALEMYQSLDNKLREGVVLNQLGLVMRAQKQYKQALNYHFEALKIYKNLNDPLKIAKVLNNIGNLYEIQSFYAKAHRYYLKSLQLKTQNGHPAISTRLNIAWVALQLGMDSEALNFASAALHLLNETNSINENTKFAYKVLAEIYEKKREYPKAITYRKLYEAVNDTIYNEKMSRQIAEMQARFDEDKKNQQLTAQKDQISILEQKKKADQTLKLALMTIAILLMLLVLIIYSRYRVKRKAGEVLEEKNKEIAKMNKELEKRMLRAQMDPHFIFNSLNSIQHFITTNEKTSALRYLSKFSKLMRQTLENSVNHSVPIADEIKLLEHYIELESLRFSHKFDYTIQVDEQLDIYNVEIPFLLLQPYVENSIVHGLANKEGKGLLSLTLESKDEYVICSVLDNGIGRAAAKCIKHEEMIKHKSRGLSVTAQRLALINKNKGRKTSVEIIDIFDDHRKPCGTKVEICIPISLNELVC